MGDKRFPRLGTPGAYAVQLRPIAHRQLRRVERGGSYGAAEEVMTPAHAPQFPATLRWLLDEYILLFATFTMAKRHTI